MLMNLFVFWILASMFFGTRQAGRAFSVIFGIFAFVWIAKLLLIFQESTSDIIYMSKDDRVLVQQVAEFVEKTE